MVVANGSPIHFVLSMFGGMNSKVVVVYAFACTQTGGSGTHHALTTRSTFVVVGGGHNAAMRENESLPSACSFWETEKVR